MNRHASRIWPHDTGLVAINRRRERRMIRRWLMEYVRGCWR